jgi:hypothetical protein
MGGRGDRTVLQSVPRRRPTMAVKQRELKDLGVLLIDFNPVVREGLQAILAKDERANEYLGYRRQCLLRTSEASFCSCLTGDMLSSRAKCR